MFHNSSRGGRGGSFFGGRGGRGGASQNTANNTTSCIPPNIDWHASRPPPNYIYGNGRGDEGFNTGIERPLDNPLDLIRNQQKLQEMQRDRMKQQGRDVAGSDIEAMLNAADAAQREAEREARIRNLTTASSNASLITANTTNEDASEEDKLLAAIPEVGKRLVEAPGERKEKERQRQMEASEDQALLLPSSLPPTTILSGAAFFASKNQTKQDKMNAISKVLKGITASASEGSSDALEEDGGVEYFTLLSGGVPSSSSSRLIDMEALKNFKQLVQRRIEMDPVKSEFQFVTLAKIEMEESGGDVRAGFDTILRGTKETGGHSSLLWFFAAKFAKEFFNDVSQARELAKNGMRKMLDILLRNNTSTNNNKNQDSASSPTLIIPRDTPKDKDSYNRMINFIHYAIQLFSSSTTNIIDADNDDDNHHHHQENAAANTTHVSEQNHLLTTILRQAVILAPTHDDFWKKLFTLEHPSQHREILTIAMKSMRESQTKIPVTLWIRMAQLEKQAALEELREAEKQPTNTTTTTTSASSKFSERMLRVKKVTDAGLIDHPNSSGLWLLQAVAVLFSTSSSSTTEANRDETIRSGLRKALEAVFSTISETTNNIHNNNQQTESDKIKIVQLYFNALKSWLNTCFDLLNDDDNHQDEENNTHEKLFESEIFGTENNNTKMSNDDGNIITFAFATKPFLVIRIAIEELVVKFSEIVYNNPSVISFQLLLEAARSVVFAEFGQKENNAIDENEEEEQQQQQRLIASSKCLSSLQRANSKNISSNQHAKKSTSVLLTYLFISIRMFTHCIILQSQETKNNGNNNISVDVSLPGFYEIILRLLLLTNLNSNNNSIHELLAGLLSQVLNSKVSTPHFLNFCGVTYSWLKISNCQNNSDKLARDIMKNEILRNISVASTPAALFHIRSSLKNLVEQIFETSNNVLVFSTFANTNNNNNATSSNSIKTEEPNPDVANTMILDRDRFNIFEFYYQQAIKFSKAISSFASSSSSTSSSPAVIESLTKIEEEIKHFASHFTFSGVSPNPLDVVNHLIIRSQLLTSLRVTKWQLQETFPSNNNNSNNSFQDLLDTATGSQNPFVDITLDSRLIVHSALYLSANSTSSSSSSLTKSKGIIEEHINSTDAKLNKAVNDRESMMKLRNNSNNNNNLNTSSQLSDKINACSLVIQRRTNTLCHLVAVRLFFEKDNNNSIARTAVLDRFASTNSKTVWRRGAAASFAIHNISSDANIESNTSFSNSAEKLMIDALNAESSTGNHHTVIASPFSLSLDPLTLVTLDDEATANLKAKLQQNVINGSIFGKENFTTSAAPTNRLLLFPPSATCINGYVNNYDDNLQINGLPSLDLLLKLLIDLTPSNNNNTNTTNPTGGSAKGAVLKANMKLIKEITTTATTAFPLVNLAASELFERSGMKEKSQQEWGKAVDGCFQLYQLTTSQRCYNNGNNCFGTICNRSLSAATASFDACSAGSGTCHFEMLKKYFLSKLKNHNYYQVENCLYCGF